MRHGSCSPQTHRAGAAPHSAVAELGVVRRCSRIVITNELELVLGSAEPPAIAPAIGLASFTVHCVGGASSVLDRARSTLAAVLRHSEATFDDLSFWRSVLPDSFVSRCAPEMTEAEKEAYMRLPVEERMREAAWSVLGWVHWLQPAERQWYWWRAMCSDSSTIVIEVQPTDWPFAHGALDWLFLASGAQSIESDDE